MSAAAAGDLLARARVVAWLLFDLGWAFEHEHQRRRTAPQSPARRWPDFEPMCAKLRQALLDLRDFIESPPAGLITVAARLREADKLYRQIETNPTADGFDSFLGFWPDLNSASQNLLDAVKATEAKQAAVGSSDFLAPRTIGAAYEPLSSPFRTIDLADLLNKTGAASELSPQPSRLAELVKQIAPRPHVLGPIQVSSAVSKTKSHGVIRPAASPSPPAQTSVEESATPTDLRDYATAAEIRAKHSPAGIVLDHRRLVRFLSAHRAIRTARPIGKVGKPRPNRLLVHLADWHKNHDALIEWDIAHGDPIQAATETEIAERTAAVHSKKQRRK